MKHKEYLAKLAEGQDIILPSGLEVRVKPLDSAVLLSGSYPAEITTLIARYMTVRAEEANREQSVEAQVENFRSNRKWGELIAKNVVVSPKLVGADEGAGGEGEDEFPVAALETGDLVFLQGLINLPLARLATFCGKQNALMERVFSGEDVEDNAVAPLRAAGAGAEPDGANPVPALSLDGSADDHQRVDDVSPV